MITDETAVTELVNDLVKQVRDYMLTKCVAIYISAHDPETGCVITSGAVRNMPIKVLLTLADSILDNAQAEIDKNESKHNYDETDKIERTKGDKP